MQDLPKEWLEFLRGQFPAAAGSKHGSWMIPETRWRRLVLWSTSMTRAGSTSGRATEVSAS